MENCSVNDISGLPFTFTSHSFVQLRAGVQLVMFPSRALKVAMNRQCNSFLLQNSYWPTNAQIHEFVLTVCSIQDAPHSTSASYDVHE